MRPDIFYAIETVLWFMYGDRRYKCKADEVYCELLHHIGKKEQG
jgi:hypothetical protein